MILLSGLENEKLWKMIKSNRLGYLIKNADKIGTSISTWCFARNDLEHVLISDGPNIQFLEDLVQSGKNENDKSHNFSNEQFESAAEMFIYLNLCPKFMSNWVKLYVELLQNGSPGMIVQTLNRILITARLKKDKTIRQISKKIFEKVNKSLALTFSTLDNLNYGIKTNSSLPNNDTAQQIQDTASEFNFSKEMLHTVNDHPIHILDKMGKVSPSAFVPFCAFGRSKSTIGQMMEDYELPVCNKFQAKILSDQLCYEIDLEKYKKKENLENDLISGLVFFMDYNEDRQVTLEENYETIENELFVDRVDASLDEAKASIYLNTIGDISDIHNS